MSKTEPKDNTEYLEDQFTKIKEEITEIKKDVVRYKTHTKALKDDIKKDSTFVYSATERQLDSLESRYNPR